MDIFIKSRFHFNCILFNWFKYSVNDCLMYEQQVVEFGLYYTIFDDVWKKRFWLATNLLNLFVQCAYCITHISQPWNGIFFRILNYSRKFYIKLYFHIKIKWNTDFHTKAYNNINTMMIQNSVVCIHFCNCSIAFLH